MTSFKTTPCREMKVNRDFHAAHVVCVCGHVSFDDFSCPK